MDAYESLTRLGLALAIGFLVGIERGWKEREAGEGERAAGLRTFALIGLGGGVFGLVSKEIGPAAFAVGFLAVAGAVTLFRWREAVSEGHFGATTVIAAFLTFAIGTYAAVGDMMVAAAAGVAMAGILAAKSWLHTWVRTLTWDELRATLILLVMTFIALPLLPDRGFGPYQALNPRDLWLMTIAVAGVSFIGYVAVKMAGVRFGSLVAGVAGGVVSSTITTVDFSRRARAEPELARLALSGALAASATMFARVGVVVALFGPGLLASLVPPLAVAFAVSLAAALVLDRPWQREAVPRPIHSPLTNPFELRAVAGFALLLAAITLLAAVLTHLLGERGGVALAAVAGLGDVDAITLSMARLAGVTPGVAAIAILVAVIANSLSKTVLATVIGGRRFGAAYGVMTLVSLAAGGIAYLVSAAMA